MSRLLFLLVPALLAVGCQSTAGPGAASRTAGPDGVGVVIVTADDAVASCSFVAPVAVEPPLTLLTRSYPELTFMARDDLQRLLKREAARGGGDTVRPMGMKDGKMQGHIYTCDVQG